MLRYVPAQIVSQDDTILRLCGSIVGLVHGGSLAPIDITNFSNVIQLNGAPPERHLAGAAIRYGTELLDFTGVTRLT